MAFDKLKLIRQALSPEAIKQGLEASRQVRANGGRLTDEQLAALPPEARANYEKAWAQVAESQARTAAAAAAHRQEQDERRALHGPAGDEVYGALPATPAPGEPVDFAADVKAQIKDLLKSPFRSTRPAPPRPPVSSDREQQAAHERAERDAARAPYLAAQRAPVAFTRLATRNKTQLAEVAAYLGSSGLAGRPELVYGCYRVPDHIGGGLTRDGSRVVEWDIVHAATSALAPADGAAAVIFEAGTQWCTRRVGEPSVLDEDLALAYLGAAGLGPEHCLGLARGLQVDQHGGGEGEQSVTLSQVAGIAVFHPGAYGTAAFEPLRAQLPLPGAPVPGVHTEVLNWRAVAAAVHPESHRRFVVPSPFPYLPSTPQELIRSYLEIVGVRPADCYSAQVTENEPRDLTGFGEGRVFTTTTNRGESQPCADGDNRPRLTGGSDVVIVYADHADYAAGRGRWAAYERDVLQASLAHGTHVRAPVSQREWLERLPSAPRRLLKTAEFVADLVDGDDTGDAFDKIPPHRYCWPPVS